MTQRQRNFLRWSLYSAGFLLVLLLSTSVLVLLCRLFTKNQIWLCSPVSAIFHNLGQLLVAAALMGTWVVMAYLPYLVIAGAVSGLFTGLCAQFLIGRLDKISHSP